VSSAARRRPEAWPCALACFLPDTTPGRRGALRSLRPHLSVPRVAVAEFVAAIPAGCGLDARR
jgi:hypothetical protein